MRRDPIVLGQNYILSGSDIGKKRPNANALIVGTTGCGKSTSVVLPTIGRMEYSNPILNCAKETDAYALMRYLEYKGWASHSNEKILSKVKGESTPKKRIFSRWSVNRK